MPAIRRRTSPPLPRRFKNAGRSAISTSPAAIASPTSWARLAAAIVAGPTAGRSSRTSWPRLAALTNTPALPLSRNPAAGAQFRDPRQHPVRALRRLDGERPFRRDHRALADVERRHRRQQSRAERDVGARVLVGRRPDDRALAARAARREIARADDLEPLALEQLRDAAQQRVVAAAKQLGDFARRARSRPSRASGRQDPAASRRRGTPTSATPRDRNAVSSLPTSPSRTQRCGKLSISRPAEPTSPTRNASRPARAHLARRLQRQAAAAADESERTLSVHAASSRAIARRQHRAIAALAQERDDLLRRRIVGEFRARPARCAPSTCPAPANNCL